MIPGRGAVSALDPAHYSLSVSLTPFERTPSAHLNSSIGYAMFSSLYDNPYSNYNPYATSGSDDRTGTKPNSDSNANAQPVSAVVLRILYNDS